MSSFGPLRSLNRIRRNLPIVTPQMRIKSMVNALFFTAAILLAGCKWYGPDVGYNNGYEPDQPIPFDHSLHAGNYKMDCKYCHTTVETSRHASVPSLNICMNCHLLIGNESPHIKKLREAYNSGQSIEWVKVNMLQDHAHFNHKRHVRRGVACQTCHGEVEKMTKVKQVKTLSMGWCVNCHREPENNAPINCTTCHH